MKKVPRVSVGIPVYNGSNFVAAAIDSVLAQTYTDFELIICDNCSTDDTEAICLSYAKDDPRIRYVRHDENLGAARNFNHLYALARGEYFKWASHDDILRADFLEKCVAILDEMPNVVVASCRVQHIDDEGRFKDVYDGRLMDQGSQSVRRRFRDLVENLHCCYEVFGLIRSEALQGTSLIGTYVTSDKTLMLELGLKGPFHEINEPLLMIRHHKGRSVTPSRYERLSWFDPRLKGKIFYPHWREGGEYTKALYRVPLSLETRLACQVFMLAWFLRHRHVLFRDLTVAFKQLVARAAMLFRRASVSEMNKPN